MKEPLARHLRKSVNCELARQLTVSPQGLAILRMLAATGAHQAIICGFIPGHCYADGERATADLVRLLERPDTSRAVTRASLSRTLRRLWRAGLVELISAWRTMTTADHAARKQLAWIEANPEAAYDAYKAFVAASDMPDHYGSVDAYLAARRARRADLRATSVQITAAGRAWLTRQVPDELTGSSSRGTSGDSADPGEIGRSGDGEILGRWADPGGVAKG